MPSLACVLLLQRYIRPGKLVYCCLDCKTVHFVELSNSACCFDDTIAALQLPWAVNTWFQPAVHKYKPLFEGGGVEHLTIEFPWTRWVPGKEGACPTAS